MREPPLVGAVRVHQVDLPKPGRIGGEVLILRRRELVGGVRVAQGTKGDQFAVGRKRTFGIVAQGRREPTDLRAIALGHENVHVFVIIPGIAALFTGGAEGEFGLLLFHRCGIQMRGGEHQLVGPRTEKGAGGLAVAGRDAVAVAALQIQQMDLVKWIRGIAFTLKDQRLAIRGEVTLAAAPPFKDQLPRVGEQTGLGFGGGLGRRAGGGGGEAEGQSPGQDGPGHNGNRAEPVVHRRDFVLQVDKQRISRILWLVVSSHDLRITGIPRNGWGPGGPPPFCTVTSRSLPRRESWRPANPFSPSPKPPPRLPAGVWRRRGGIPRRCRRCAVERRDNRRGRCSSGR